MAESLEEVSRAGDYFAGGSGISVGGPHPFLQAWSWLELLLAIFSCLAAVLFGLFLPALLLGAPKASTPAEVQQEDKKEKLQAAGQSSASAKGHPVRAGSGCRDAATVVDLGFELHDWYEVASSLPDSPWSFDRCGSLEDVLATIWRSPLDRRLQGGFAELHRRMRRVRVARCVLDRPVEKTYFCIVYTLSSGAEIFGGSPVDDAIGLSLDAANEDDRPRHRRRRRRSSSEMRETPKAPQLPLPCLAPFYRVHDGVGVLLSLQHLPQLLTSPDDSINGSCFYIYPMRALEVLDEQRPHLVKFARVDRHCVACADRRREEPNVVYADPAEDLVQDDEAPLDFVDDTICNIAGRKAAGR